MRGSCARVKSYEARIGREIEEKEGLLNDIETIKVLKLMPLSHYKERLIECRNFSLKYADRKTYRAVQTDYACGGA